MIIRMPAQRDNLTMPTDDIFYPFDRLLNVTILGRKVRMPENNSILRGLQFLNMEGISSADLCWNGDCLNCTVVIRKGDGTKTVTACRTMAFEGMEVIRLAPAVDIFASEKAD